MYSYEDRLRAVELYIKLGKRVRATIRQLGYPRADVPVFQVSLPSALDSDSAWAFGEALAPLATEGVLIVGSGSLTHNLYEFPAGHGREEAYAAEFAGWIREAVLAGDAGRLRQALTLAPHAKRADPSSEHFVPLLVAAGAAGASPSATVVEGGITHGVLSMDSFVFGDMRLAETVRVALCTRDPRLAALSMIFGP